MRGLLAVVVMLTLPLAACASDAPSDTGNAAPTPEDTGHSHDIDIGHAVDAAQADRTVEVSASEYAFEPSSIAVDRGEVVEFVVTNDGDESHEFTIGDQAFHDDAMDGEHDHPDQTTGVLAPGESGSLTWKFSAVANILFACHVDDHFDRNMFGSIRVLL